MSKKRRPARIAALMIGLLLLVLLAARVAGADGQCHDNYPKPQPRPSPSGPVQRVMWKQASTYAEVKVVGGQLRYQICSAWQPPPLI